MGMSLLENSFDNEGGYFGEDHIEPFESKTETHLINPLKILLENKTENNSYAEIYTEHLEEKVLIHGEFVKYPKDEIIKAFNSKSAD